MKNSEPDATYTIHLINDKVKCCWDEYLATVILEKARDRALTSDSLRSLLKELLINQVNEAEALAISLITLPPPEAGEERAKAIVAAQMLMLYTEDAGWSVIWSAIQQDPDFGREVLEFVSYSTKYQGSLEQILKADCIADLYIFIAKQYADLEDKQEDSSQDQIIKGIQARIVTSEDSIKIWRDHIPQRLQERGTPEACEALRKIIREFPELKDKLQWRLLEAEATARRKTWEPLQAEEFLKIVSNYTNIQDIGIQIERKQPTIEYQDFQILVDKNKNIRASSDQGDVLGELHLGINDIELELKLIESNDQNNKLLKTLGNKLYQALFPNQINALFHAAISGAQANEYSVRLRLIFESPELAALPWEFLYDEQTNTFLANDKQTVVSRYIDVPLEKRNIKAAKRPLKILLAIASPKDLATLDASGEEQLIRQALQEHIQADQIELDVLHDATIRNIRRKQEEKPYNVFHFIGHGVFDNNKGQIALVDKNGQAQFLDDERFASFFLGNRSFGLVVLNCCQGATVSTNQAFAGTVLKLVQKGIPAVVAMQYSISDSTAKLFADEFYSYLAQGNPVDAAIQKTRNAISQEFGFDKRDFATPTLYMRAKDGIILDGL